MLVVAITTQYGYEMPSLKTTFSPGFWKTLLVFAIFFATVIFVAWATVIGSANSLALGKPLISAGTIENSLNQQETLDKLPESLNPFFALTSSNLEVGQQALKAIEEKWHPGSTTMLIEIARYCRNRSTLVGLFSLADSKTGNSFKSDIGQWHQWIWDQKYDPHPDYTEFKKHLYGKIDPRFEEYYESPGKPTIRLDEIRWGGVVRDGIPPLKNPKMIGADQATYLEDSNVVFGIVINGDARCYPKRILAWHEMFKDTIGGQSVAGVY